jgi:hypothetical protein
VIVAIGSGLAGQVALKKETTYGTRVVPDLFYEFESEGGIRNQNFLASRQLRSGRTFQSSARRVPTTRDAGITIQGEVPNKGFGSILDLGHGNTVTPVQQGATTAYLQTHNWSGDPSKSATIQAGKPSVNAAGVGTVNPFDYIGSMLSQLQLQCAVDAWLTFTAGFDCQDVTTSETLATPSYPTALEGFHFQQCSVTANGVVQDLTTGSLAKSMGLDVSRPRNTARHGMRSSPLKAAPVTNDYSPGSGSLGLEYNSNVIYGLYAAQTVVPLVFDFTSSSLAGVGFPYRFTATIAAGVFTSAPIQVNGPDVLQYEAGFDILDDGTNPPIKFEIMEVRTTAL